MLVVGYRHAREFVASSHRRFSSECIEQAIAIDAWLVERFVRRRLKDRPDRRPCLDHVAHLERRIRSKQSGLGGSDLSGVIVGDSLLTFGYRAGKEIELTTDIEQARDAVRDDSLEDLLVVGEFGRDRGDPLGSGGDTEL